MIIFDTYSYNKFKNLKKALLDKNIPFVLVSEIDYSSINGNDEIICIFNITKCFISGEALSLLQNNQTLNNLKIILNLSISETAEPAISFIKNISQSNSKNYNIVAEFDNEDEQGLIDYFFKPQKEKTNKVTIYTDGACSGNPGAGGWAAILIGLSKEKTISGGEAQTTNNRMELMAVIEGLKALKQKCEVEIYSDSAYVVNAFEKGWLEQWKLNGWKNSSNGPIKNIDLWQQLDEKMKEHNVHFNKVKGHSDNEFNNRCDKLAVFESQKYIN